MQNLKIKLTTLERAHRQSRRKIQSIQAENVVCIRILHQIKWIYLFYTQRGINLI